MPERAPKTVNMDFEAENIEAIKRVFPRAEVQCCFFHFSQSLEKGTTHWAYKYEQNQSGNSVTPSGCALPWNF